VTCRIFQHRSNLIRGSGHIDPVRKAMVKGEAEIHDWSNLHSSIDGNGAIYGSADDDRHWDVHVTHKRWEGHLHAMHSQGGNDRAPHGKGI
jgi:hypothetical protein